MAKTMSLAIATLLIAVMFLAFEVDSRVIERSVLVGTVEQTVGEIKEAGDEITGGRVTAAIRNMDAQSAALKRATKVKGTAGEGKIIGQITGGRVNGNAAIRNRDAQSDALKRAIKVEGTAGKGSRS